MVDAPDAAERKTPPDLPQSLVNPVPLVIAGTIIWLSVFLILLVLKYPLNREVGVWFSTALAGFGLGLLGLSVVAWQRRASRRGSRSAQRGL